MDMQKIKSELSKSARLVAKGQKMKFASIQLGGRKGDPRNVLRFELEFVVPMNQLPKTSPFPLPKNNQPKCPPNCGCHKLKFESLGTTSSP